MLVHRRVTPSSKFAGTHLYTWVERGTMKVKCLAQEHNTVPRPGLEPGPFDPESSALTIRPPRLPQVLPVNQSKLRNCNIPLLVFNTMEYPIPTACQKKKNFASSCYPWLNNIDLYLSSRITVQEQTSFLAYLSSLRCI